MKDINLLLTEESQEENQETGKKVQIPTIKIAFAAIVICLAGALLFVPKMILGSLDVKSESLRSELMAEKYQQVKLINSRIASATASLDAKQAVLSEIDGQYYPVIQVLTAITQAQPTHCSIHQIDYKGNKITLAGAALNSTYVGEFMINLDRLESIRVDGESKNIKIEKSGSNVKFQFTLTVGKAGEE